MNRTIRFIIYAVITAICILAIFVGVYAVVFKNQTRGNVSEENMVAETDDENTKTKDSFKDLFANQFLATNYRQTNVEKIEQDKDLVYEVITYNETKENQYELDLHIPFININNELINSYNDNTQNIFVQKANDIIMGNEQEQYTVYDVYFTSYVNNDILSVAIMANLKQGNSAQRTMIQTYNYNIATGQEVTINDILDARGLDKSVVNKEIKEVVEKAATTASSVASTGYEVYQRDLKSDIYKVTNVETFIQGPNGELYIIYAYGNNAYTSEMDVIQI